MTDEIALARACSEAMHANDDASQMLGMEIVETTPGYARLTMQVRKEFTNGHDICHGGFIFTLADSAFAHACNNRNHITLAAGASIEYMAPAKTGDRLTAIAHERKRGGKTGVYDVEVSNQDGVLLALFRGNSYQIRGQVVPTGDNE